MAEFKIRISADLYLSSVHEGDKPALLEYLQTKDIYNTTLNIPHPYTETDADFWIHKRMQITRRQGIEVTFAIRDKRGRLIGVVGADELEINRRSLRTQNREEENREAQTTIKSRPDYRAHRAEIGYWLGCPFWGKGLMTQAVGAFVRYAFRELHLRRLTAHVFEENLASARVLEKNGFKLEGELREHFLKDGKALNAKLYGLLRDDLGR
jgi:RimJ/RimL family protein N-acetyltransferase